MVAISVAVGMASLDTAIAAYLIDPAETRIKLINGLQMLQTKREELPKRKHGNMPL